MYRVLIADDEPHLSFMMERQLRRLGCQTLVVRDGAEALAQAKAGPPHLVITDMQMPELDGLSMCKALGSDPDTADVPVIMVTGRGHHVQPADLRDTNIRHVLLKPFSMQELLGCVCEVLDVDTLDEPRTEAA